MKFDDASWHYSGDYPKNVPQENAFTHIGMFLAWVLLNGLGGKLHTEELPDALALLQTRKLTPGVYLQQYCDGKLTDEDLNETACEFAKSYYEKSYFEDYIVTLAAELNSPYQVPDSWETYDKIAQVISSRYHEHQFGAGKT